MQGFGVGEVQMSGTGLHVSRLRVEYLDNPIGIVVDRPRLSWIVASGERNQAQCAYRILVSSDRALLDGDEGDLWDSGRIESDRTTQVVYSGTPLAARQRAWWKVRSWNQDDLPSAWSDAAYWEASLLQPAHWVGRWLSLPGLTPDPDIPETAELDALVPAPLFRRAFTITGEVASARLYATARGVYEASLNGEVVGDQVLSPGWTDYTRRQQFQTCDVTEGLVAGDNVLGGWVAPVWFCGYVGWQRQSRHYGTTPQLLMQLHIDYADGASEIIATDAEWRATTGPVRYADLLMGEYYDARRGRCLAGTPRASMTATGAGWRSPRAVRCRSSPSPPNRFERWKRSPRSRAPSQHPARSSSTSARTSLAGSRSGRLVPPGRGSRFGSGRCSMPMARSTPRT